MTAYTVRKGKRYQATIALNWVERLASNEMVAQPFRDAGFVDVTVMGEGGARQATARWPHDDATAEIPSQIASIAEIEV
jgi:hypothetical protein